MKAEDGLRIPPDEVMEHDINSASVVIFRSPLTDTRRIMGIFD